MKTNGFLPVLHFCNTQKREQPFGNGIGEAYGSGHISYSHDSAEHERRVLALANELRTQGGVDAWIDRYRPDPDEGWISWMRDHIGRADRVLLVFTET